MLMVSKTHPEQMMEENGVRKLHGDTQIKTDPDTEDYIATDDEAAADETTVEVNCESANTNSGADVQPKEKDTQDELETTVEAYCESANTNSGDVVQPEEKDTQDELETTVEDNCESANTNSGDVVQPEEKDTQDELETTVEDNCESANTNSGDVVQPEEKDTQDELETTVEDNCESANTNSGDVVQPEEKDTQDELETTVEDNCESANTNSGDVVQPEEKDTQDELETTVEDNRESANTNSGADVQPEEKDTQDELLRDEPSAVSLHKQGTTPHDSIREQRALYGDLPTGYKLNKSSRERKATGIQRAAVPLERQVFIVLVVGILLLPSRVAAVVPFDAEYLDTLIVYMRRPHTVHPHNDSTCVHEQNSSNPNRFRDQAMDDQEAFGQLQPRTVSRLGHIRAPRHNSDLRGDRLVIPEVPNIPPSTDLDHSELLGITDLSSAKAKGGQPISHTPDEPPETPPSERNRREGETNNIDPADSRNDRPFRRGMLDGGNGFTVGDPVDLNSIPVSETPEDDDIGSDPNLNDAFVNAEHIIPLSLESLSLEPLSLEPPGVPNEELDMVGNEQADVATSCEPPG